MSSAPAERPKCFIAMPITTHPDEKTLYGDADHWSHVIDHLFVPAVEKAGFEAIKPSASGTSMIHGRIVQYLIEADMVLCDLSQHNPNVFFELGVRTSLDKPIALVKDEHRNIPFDTSGLNTHSYSSTLDVWKLEDEIDALAQHIQDSVRECAGQNPLWKHFGFTLTADRPGSDISPTDARLELLAERMSGIENALLHPRGVVPPTLAADGNPDTAKVVDFVVSATVPELTGMGVQQSLDGERIYVLHTPDSTSSDQQRRISDLARGFNVAQHLFLVQDSSPNRISFKVKAVWG